MNIGKDNRDHKDIIAASQALVERATKKETIESFLTTSARVLASRVAEIQKKAEVVYDICNAYVGWGMQQSNISASKLGTLDDKYSTLRVQIGDAPMNYIDVRSCVPEITFCDCMNVVVPNDGKPKRDFKLTNDEYEIYKLICPNYKGKGAMSGLMESARAVSAIRDCLDAAECILVDHITKLAKTIKAWDSAVDAILSIANPKDDNNAQ